MRAQSIFNARDLCLSKRGIGRTTRMFAYALDRVLKFENLIVHVYVNTRHEQAKWVAWAAGHISDEHHLRRLRINVGLPPHDFDWTLLRRPGDNPDYTEYLIDHSLLETPETVNKAAMMTAFDSFLRIEQW